MAEKVEVKFTKLFINNEWVDSADGSLLTVENPATRQPICQVQEAKKADVDKAVAAAKAAFRFDSKWRTMDASQRGVLLCKLADLVDEEIMYIANLESLDNGKTPASATADVLFAIDVLRYYGGFADKIHGLTIPVDGQLMAFTRMEPVGVVAGITPWNYPFQLAVAKLAPALAAGCTLVLKSAEQTPLSTLYLAELARRAGFPPGVFNVLSGFGETAGAALTAHPDVSKVSFTGSTEVGRLILQAAGVSNLKRVSLELGGKSPLIVCDDCPNLDEAVDLAFRNALMNHGQCCVAATRTLVQAGIYDQFVERTRKRAEAVVVGDPFDDATDQGPQIDAVQTQRILELIEAGRQEGARLVTGGGLAQPDTYFVQPTVFADVQDHMRIAREEIFGPVQSIFKFSTLDEAIDRANATSYGLGAGILSSNVDTALYAAQRLQAGSVWVNCYMDMGPQTPFGGFKQSGHNREFGLYGLEPYLEKKVVIIASKNKIS